MAISPAVATFQAGMNDYFTKQGTLIDNIVADVTNLDSQIAALQASQGVLTPEDQAALDSIQALSTAALAKVQTLDDMTPPLPAPAPSPSA